MPLDRDAWLAERRTGIGSTDAAAIVGLSPWKTALDVYLDKKGLLPDRPPTPEMAWGLRLEPVLAEAYEERTGLTVFAPDGIARCNVHPWLIASLDRIATAEGNGYRAVELKTARTAAGWGDEGTDEIPETYMLQVQHQLLVTGFATADVAVLIGGSDFRIYHVQAHVGIAGQLLSAEREFWSRLQEDRPPEPDWSHPRTPELIRQLHGLDAGEARLYGSGAVDLVYDIHHAKRLAKEHQTVADVARAKLQHLMGSAGRAVLDDGTVLTRKKIHRAGYQVDATDYIDFRIKQPKERAR